MKFSQSWKPTSNLALLKKRASVYYLLRKYFFEHNVLEVETPILSCEATIDQYIESFLTCYRPSTNSEKSHVFYLQTSPEFHMKRLLAAYKCDIYSLCKVFRNGDFGRLHNPEFTMLEWYRVGMTDQELMDDISGLLKFICPDYNEHGRFSYQRLFEQYFDINPHHATHQELIHIVKKFIDIDVVNLGKNDALDLLFSTIIEPKLKVEDNLSGMFVYDYPASMAALSQIKTRRDGTKVSSRFEFFMSGYELANGYHELTDSKKQQQRFEQEQLNRKTDNLPIYPYSTKLVRALDGGFPDCSGVALGVDRLLMCIEKKEHIEEVLSFDFAHA